MQQGNNMQNLKNISNKKLNHSAFTMIELVFVIVILGILAGVAIPKLAATRSDAEITKGRADIASIRSAIVTERQSRLIKGINSFIPRGTGTYTAGGSTYRQMDNGGLFGGVLSYPIANVANTNGKWSSSTSGTYKFRVKGVDTVFTYYDSTAGATQRGTFVCTSGSNDCDALTQ